MSEASWQEVLRQRLVERNSKEAAYAPIIEQYRRLAQQTKLLKERNASLLKAVGSVRSNPNSSTVFVPGVDDNPVRVAYVSSLESQISSLRDEMAAVYKTQGQNAQRLLSMTETLREKEELARTEADNLRKAREEVTSLKRKVDQHNELMAEKDRTAQVLHDEINTLQLELGQLEERNGILSKDNAKLLQRWLDAKQSEANRLNEANDFYEDMKSRHQAVLSWRDGSGKTGASSTANDEKADVRSIAQASVLSGNGQANGEQRTNPTTDGTRSPPETGNTLSPNG
ncbi:ATG16-domain-containing protein [Schizopora paradoxa]|uniref:ATG16-domain-containing protein n=1 Tax=Schizopora paradoxa TaxID=27342 RepID=A0A0H2RPT8_9AGAM|nr:ATG16-domain-containing protein [Schizopora paradoxa]